MIDFKKGYIIKKCDNIEPLKEIQNYLCKLLHKHFDFYHDDPFTSLNQLHKFAPNLNATQINEKRVGLIEDFNNEIDCSEMIFSAFETIITQFLGPDILAQKKSNVVIQMPNDPNPSEIHRDAPSHSPYEIVLWVPMVDCFKTKAMHVLDHQKSNVLYDFLAKNDDWANFEKEATAQSEYVPVNFGEALVFSTTVLHGSHINKENETRVSLNLRYKNIFSPSGLKNQLQYFKVLKTSDLLKIGSELQFKKIDYNLQKNKKEID
jgi:sporadic carbohydrate cluster 2OG-Fe(II) oxygenase